jgi:hypothetical protein
MKNSSFARPVLALALGMAVSSLTATIAAAGGPGGGSGGSGGGSGGTSGTTTSSTVAFSNFGPSAPAASGGGWAMVGLQATGYFDAEVVPSSQSREAWTVNPMGSMGLQFYTDPYSSIYLNQAQGAFEISVVP